MYTFPQNCVILSLIGAGRADPGIENLIFGRRFPTKKAIQGWILEDGCLFVAAILPPHF
jgi:hypothetical protein